MVNISFAKKKVRSQIVRELIGFGYSTGEISEAISSIFCTFRSGLSEEYLCELMLNNQCKRIEAAEKGGRTRSRLNHEGKIKTGFQPGHTYSKRTGVYKLCENCGEKFYTCRCYSLKRFCNHKCHGEWMRKTGSSPFKGVAWNKGLTKETDERVRLVAKKISARHILNSHHRGKTYEEMYGAERAKELRARVSKGNTGKTISGETRQQLRISVRALYEDEEYVKKKFESEHRSPNKFESAFMSLISKREFNVEFVGDKSFWLYLTQELRREYNTIALNPDCVIRPFSENKKVIELYGIHWHNEEDKQRKQEIYRRLGIDSLFIWDSEFYKDPEGIVSQVKDFIENGRLFK